MSELTEFLLARIAEDEVVATLRGWHDQDCSTIPAGDLEYIYPCDCGVPERLKAECEAKRAIVAAFDPECPDLDPYVGRDVISMLAAIYGGHPDYRQDWKMGGTDE